MEKMSITKEQAVEIAMQHWKEKNIRGIAILSVYSYKKFFDISASADSILLGDGNTITDCIVSIKININGVVMK